MATIKSYTDIEQSKKLAKILPLESADMYWWSSGKRYYIEAMNDGDFNEEEGHIHAWSLAALLNILPAGKSLIHGENTHKYKLINCIVDAEWHDNPVDACVAMVEKLHELKLL